MSDNTDCVVVISRLAIVGLIGFIASKYYEPCKKTTNVVIEVRDSTTDDSGEDTATSQAT